MSLKSFTSDQLIALEGSLAEGKTRGAKFSLADVRSEIQRRRPHRFDPRVMAATILQQSQESLEQCTTYGDVWRAMTGGAGWIGNSSQAAMGRELANLIAYCHLNKLPILTTLVVRKNQKLLSEAAVTNICTQCANLGIDVGPDRKAFVASQAAASRAIVVGQLPAA